MPRRLLPLLAPVALLTACAHDPLIPDAERFSPAEMPTVPEGEAVCDGEPCLSQRQADQLFNEVIDTAEARGGQLCYLADYFAVEAEGC